MTDRELLFLGSCILSIGKTKSQVFSELSMHDTPLEAVEIAEAILTACTPANPALRAMSACVGGGGSLNDQVAQTEQVRIRQALDKSQGNVLRAAYELGIKRTTLVSKIKRYGINKYAA